MGRRVSHNVLVDTIYGPMIVNRHAGEFDPLAKCGVSPSHAAIEAIVALAHCCGDGFTAIDVGACFGTFTLALSKVAADHNGTVLAFEPQRWLFQCMMASLALNDVDNVDARNCAIGDRDGVCTVPAADYQRSAAFGALPIADFAHEGSWADFGQEKPSGGYQVPLVRLDSVSGLGADLVKIDTEGMELHVLRGAEGLIKRCRPVLYVEHIKCDKPAMLAWLHERDYLTYINGCDYIAIPREKRERFPKLHYDRDDAETLAQGLRDNG